jgi:hypothetical protein
MSPQLLAMLQRLARQTRDDVHACNVDQCAEYGRGHSRPSYTVRDFYRPAELVRLWHGVGGSRFYPSVDGLGPGGA